MANDDDEFGFKSLAESFKPEVKKEEAQAAKAAKVAPPAMPQPVATKPVVPAVAMPALPEVKPQEVAASVPQQAVPELPAIQNPVFNPEFQKAAAVASLPAMLGGAALGAGAAYGLYKGRKSIQDRSIGKPMNAPADFGGNLGKQLEGMDMSRVSQSDLQLLQKAEANRIAKQAAAQAEINKLPGFTPPGASTSVAPIATNPVPAQTPPTIQAQIQTPTQNRIPSMMAAQEMSNPLGGLASAYTEPLRPPPTVAEMGQQSGGVISEAAKAPAAAIPPAEKNKGGRPKGVEAKKWTYEAGAQLPEGTVFKEGWGGADNWLNNEVGKEKAKLIRETFNQGKPFGEGSKENMARAANAMNEFGLVQYMSGDQPKILSKENRERFGIAPPEQHGRLNKTFDKAVKVGGVAGLLLTAAEAANAKQAAQNIVESLLPISMTPSQLAPGTVYTPEQQREYTRQLERQQKAELQKLGSPYRSVPPPR